MGGRRRLWLPLALAGCMITAGGASQPLVADASAVPAQPAAYNARPSLGAHAVESGGRLAATAISTRSPARRADGTETEAPPCGEGTTVRTDKGPICGTVNDGLSLWQGVPYAAPPVGHLRWRSPRPHSPWQETRRATKPGPLCPQPSIFGGSPSLDEDCLRLSVTAPEDASRGDRLPVMVQLHGGGFTYLGPGNGAHLVHVGEVIHVGVNYRLGIMGFLAHAALGPHSGDYGLQDQQAALRWVQRNVTRFGGDPDNVTIYGASAGGSSVCDHVVSPASKGLFDKGISQSGFYNALSADANTSWQAQDCMADLPTEAEAQRAGARFAAELGCGDASDAADCLREVPVADLLKAEGNGLGPNAGTIAPIVNGTTLPMSPGKAFKTGHFNHHVALIMGVARDETQTGLAADSAKKYRRLVHQQYGSAASEVLARYPLRRFPSPFVAFRTVTADSLSVCPALLTEKRLSRWIPVYGYQFEDADAPPAPFLDPSKPNGAYHVGEGMFLRGTSDLDANQKVLNTVIPKQWTAFARDGDPTTAGTPHWPRIRRRHGHPTIMQLRPAGDSELDTDIALNHQCRFWNQLVAYPARGHGRR